MTRQDYQPELKQSIQSGCSTDEQPDKASAVSERSTELSRTITEHEMARRLAMAKAQSRITDLMFDQTTQNEGLTAMEWVNVLHNCQSRMIGHGLREEWEDS